MKIYGHRGSPRTHTENTLDSFREAFKQGANGVELDVRLNGSDDPVVFHDSTTVRFNGYRLPIDSIQTSELSHFPIDGNNGPILKLSDFLEEFRDKEFILDLKTNNLTRGFLEKKVARLLEEFSVSDGVTISSTSPISLCRFYVLNKKIELALIVERSSVIQPLLQRMLYIHYLHMNERICSDKKLRHIRRMGLKSRIWTVNSIDKMSLYARYAEGIITDDVLLLKNGLREVDNGSDT